MEPLTTLQRFRACAVCAEPREADEAAIVVAALIEGLDKTVPGLGCYWTNLPDLSSTPCRGADHVRAVLDAGRWPGERGPADPLFEAELFTPEGAVPFSRLLVQVTPDRSPGLALSLVFAADGDSSLGGVFSTILRATRPSWAWLEPPCGVGYASPRKLGAGMWTYAPAELAATKSIPPSIAKRDLDGLGSLLVVMDGTAPADSVTYRRARQEVLELLEPERRPVAPAAVGAATAEGTARVRPIEIPSYAQRPEIREPADSPSLAMQTLDAAPALQRSPLPFSGKSDSAPSGPPAVRGAPENTGTLDAHPAAPHAPATPFVDASGDVKLTLEQYASLCVELALWPAKRDLTLGRYGFANAAQYKALTDAFARRFVSEPPIRDHWLSLCNAYRASLQRR